MKRLFLIISLLSASLLSEAAIVLPDSMLTIRKVYDTAGSDTSTAIIQTMRERQLAPSWQLDMAEGDCYYAMLDYTKGLMFYERAYASPDIKDSIYVQMDLLKRLMRSHDILFNEEELVTYLHELRQRALQYQHDAYLSMADFIIGKRQHYHRKKQEGYNTCLKALELMKNSNYPRKQNVLCNYYAELLQMYMVDGRYDDALRMSLLQEEATLHIKSINIKEKESLRFVYALRASLLAKAGRDEEADRAYAEWKKEPDGNCVTDKAILDYLILNHHYQEADDIIENYCNMLRTQKDNYSYRMMSMLTTGVQVDAALGNYEEVVKDCQEIRSIVDSLHIDKSESLMLTSWDLIQKVEDVEKKNVILNVLGVILVIGIIVGGIILYYTRSIHHRNKKLLKVLNTLEAYRNNANSENSPQEELTAAEENDDLDIQQDDNERLFVKLDRQITRDRLFLTPNFGRDDMARLIGVDKNRIGNIMSKYSNASNASVYINTKRVEYGAKLLLKHPDYTIAAIANECGMTNTVTFNRTFKEVYGMTPSEYRANMKSINKDK